jgi:NADH-ubiquinone oxidoreductase chain 4
MIFDVLGFFIFFETTLIPIYLLILVFGSRERKVRASYMISLYTLFGSIFMFFNIIYLFSKIGTTNYFHLLMIQFTTLDSLFL